MDELQQQYRVMFENMAQGAFYQSADGSLFDVNPAALSIFGLTRDQFLGRTSFHPEWRVIGQDGRDLPPDQHPSMVALRTGQKVCDVVAGIFNAQRQTFVWVTINAIPLFLEGAPSPYQVLVTLHDFTERKQMVDALRLSEERFSGAFEYSAIGMAIIAPNGTWVKVNRSVCSIVGYSEDELSAMTFQDITHPDDLDSDLEHVRQMLAGEIETYTMEKRYFHKTGEIVWVLLSVALVRDEAGTPMYFVSQIQNITERKQAETALKASVAEKEVLLRELHHRVKNNMAAIIGLLEMQQDGIADEAALDSLQDLSGRIMSMALVHETLYHSENMARIDFQEYLNNLTTHLLDSYGVRQHIRCGVDATGVEMGLDMAIPAGLVVNELVTNAMKHAFPARKPLPGSDCCEILIKAHAYENSFTLTVADNGVGLPPDLDWRSCPTLGLSLARMLGENQLRGQLQLDQSEGACFVLRFNDRWREEDGR